MSQNFPFRDDSIVGVKFKLLKSHGDSRGFFREIVRFNEPLFEGNRFAQWSHSLMQKNVVKAWHYHHKQLDWWYVGLGLIETVLFDNREESPTYRTKLHFTMGESSLAKYQSEVCVKIPPGVLHGCKVVSPEAHLFYITSETYDQNEEGRFPYNSKIVEHDWGKDVIVADNDKREFVPVATRKIL